MNALCDGKVQAKISRENQSGGNDYTQLRVLLAFDNTDTASRDLFSFGLGRFRQNSISLTMNVSPLLQSPQQQSSGCQLSIGALNELHNTFLSGN
jgi:hypothetical protein